MKQRNHSETGQNNNVTKKKVAKVHFQLIFLYPIKNVKFNDDKNYNTEREILFHELPQQLALANCISCLEL